MSFEKVTDLDSTVVVRPTKRGQPDAAGRVASLGVDSRVSLLAQRHVVELQRVLGNRATSELVSQQIAEAVTVQRKGGAEKGMVLPGRGKRRRQAQEDELAQMDAANEAWEAGRDEEEEAEDPTANPYAVLDGLEEAEQAERDRREAEELERKRKAAEEAERKKGPTLEAFQKAGNDVQKLKAINFGDITEDVAKEMRRLWRMHPSWYPTIGELVKAAGGKVAERVDWDQADSRPSLGGGRINAKGRQGVGGSKKAKKQAIEFDAGTGATWHVHYKEHVKYGSRADTRVDFSGRTKQEVLKQLSAAAASVPDKANLQKCRIWINKNLK